VVLHLEGTHDVPTSNYEVHDARYQNALTVGLALLAHSNHVNEVQKRQELFMALFMAFQELQLKLLHQV
jgi:hypothetical protein